MDIKYSVVIPHFNIPDLLLRCIKSIPCRKDIEVIVVDNKSDIENQRKASSICAQFPNVIFIQDSIGNGAGHARNIGMANATGNWLVFADADDFFSPLFWDKVDSYLNESKVDICYFKVSAVNSDTLELGGRDYDYLNSLVDAFVGKKNNADISIRTNYPAPWGKVFNRAFILRELLMFDEIPTSNDIMFSAISGVKAKSIDACDCIMYVVTYREGSLTRLKTPDALFCRFDALLRRNVFYRKVGMANYNSLPIIPMWRTLRRFGICEFFRYLKLLFKYRMNPFSGLRGVIERKYIPFIASKFH